eukprot:Blabericola_migrator_1__4182@NODE_227_length_11116_cov_134_193049_g193_i0_p1_GENE_NODE_227_length_11116_cov_134_193049_g193_i0NODE_227_length_11116_cov_134_193049_g193_i0_p1_ORF_typecomplete_len1165_score221_94Vac14_Fab1_bd/PF12755_7/5_4e02Vac14_Fab1_bd/PF12755_7/1_6e03Vac14_Fab1_bd/PF12755_7/9_5e03Vac14_Fab1_bd/PF12755_7/0_0099Vac14_Fab1_bd/PF12755_7/0_0068Vac14_Fab1_bd/PF12755_7/1_8e03Vac14_Fab1_bd/PF12755_7/2_1e03HEAT_EZ/PF13513_6/2_9HEAT_EZ/PF13513_6/5e03HEAT_EZ/PF13513_6/0_0034HEAT_EZ/PF135
MSASDLTYQNVGVCLQDATDPSKLATASKVLQTLNQIDSKLYLSLVLQHACQNESAEVRLFACVHVRSKIKSLCSLLNEAEQRSLWEQLLTRIVIEPDEDVINSLSHVLASMAVHKLKDWKQDLISLVDEKLCCSATPMHQVAGYNILSNILLSNEALDGVINHIVPLLAKGLSSPHAEVARSAVMVVESAASNEIVPRQSSEWRALLLPMIEACSRGITTNSPELVETCLSCLVEIVESTEWMSEGDIQQVTMPIVSNIAAQRDQPIGIRDQALNFVHYAAEKIPSAFTKSPELMQGLLEALIGIACDPEEAAALELKDEDTQTPFKMACQALDSLALTITPSKLFPILYPVLLLKLQQSDLLDRRCGLVFLGVLSEGCEGQMRKKLNEYLDYYWAALSDNSELIRAAAALGIGHMAEYLQPEILRYSDKALTCLVPTLTSCLQSRMTCSDPSVVGAIDYVLNKICFTMELFCSGTSQTFISSIQGELVPLLIQCLGTDPSDSAKASCYSALSGIAAAAKASFAPHLKDISQLLVKVLAEQGGDVVKAVHLASNLLPALASDELKAERMELVGLIMRLLANSFKGESNDEDDETAGIKEHCFDFLHALLLTSPDTYLPIMNDVMAMIVKTVEAGEHIMAHDEDEAEEEDDTEKFAVHTALLDEMISALNVLICSISVLPATALDLYVERIVELVSSLAGHYFPQIKILLLQLCVALTICLMNRNPPAWYQEINHPTYESEEGVWTPAAKRGWQAGYPVASPLHAALHELWENCLWTPFAAYMADDADASVVTEATENLGDLLAICGPALLAKGDGQADPERIELIRGVLESILSNNHECQSMYKTTWSNDADYRQREEGLFEGTMSLLSAVMEVVSISSATALFDQFNGLIAKLVDHPTPPVIRCIAVGTFSELFRIYKASGMDPQYQQKINVYVENVFPRLPAGLQQGENDSLCQNAAFCAGVCIEVAPNNPIVRQNLPALMKCAQEVLQRLTSDQMVSREAYAVDNVVAMIARVINAVPEIQCSAADVTPLINIVAQNLPLKQDHTESESIANALSTIVLQRPIDVKSVWVPLARGCVVTLASADMSKVLQHSNVAGTTVTLHHQLTGSFIQLLNLLGEEIGLAVTQLPAPATLVDHLLVKELASTLTEPMSQSYLQSCFA